MRERNFIVLAIVVALSTFLMATTAFAFRTGGEAQYDKWGKAPLGTHAPSVKGKAILGRTGVKNLDVSNYQSCSFKFTNMTTLAAHPGKLAFNRYSTNNENGYPTTGENGLGVGKDVTTWGLAPDTATKGVRLDYMCQ